MKKAGLLLALAWVTTVAMAGERAVVVKDTRQYASYTQSIEKDGGCSVAKDPDNPQKGDCKEVRDKAVVGGQWEIRVGSVCREETYKRLENNSSMDGRPVLSLGTTSNTFKCDEHGNPV